MPVYSEHAIAAYFAYFPHIFLAYFKLDRSEYFGKNLRYKLACLDLTVHTACVAVVNSETGGIAVVRIANTMRNPKTTVSARLNVLIRKVDRLQSAVVRVKRVRVQDERRVEFEKW